MPGSDHLNAATTAAAAVKNSTPSGDNLTPEAWQEFERLVRELEECMKRLHPVAHSSADAHAAHAQRTATRVERRAAHVQQTGEHATHMAATVAEAHADLSQHEQGTDEHAAATNTHAEAQNNHANAQTAHEESKTKHADAQRAHEQATTHAQHSEHNRQQADSARNLTDELVTHHQNVGAGLSQVNAETAPEEAANIRSQHQGTVDQMKSHAERIEGHLNSMHAESLDEPEDDSAEDDF